MKRTLSAELKIFIVQALACYKSPPEVIEEVRRVYGVELSRQNIYDHNPLRSEKLGQQWKILFEQTRSGFLKEIVDIGIVHRSYRLHQLQRLYHLAGNNIALKAQLLEQAAKEVGGMFVSTRAIEILGKETLGRLAGLLGSSSDREATPEG